MEKPRFKSGTRIKFTRGGLKGRTGIIMGLVADAQIEAYSVGMEGLRLDPYNQQYWRKISAKYLEYASVIDQLGDVLDEDER